jgi:hypothetical protein
MAQTSLNPLAKLNPVARQLQVQPRCNGMMKMVVISLNVCPNDIADG